MISMRKLAAALVLGPMLCLTLFTTGASAQSALHVGHISVSAVAVARDHDIFDFFGGLGGCFFSGFGCGDTFASANTHVSFFEHEHSF